jgi:hypothetical protein
MWKGFDPSFGTANVNENVETSYTLQDANVGHVHHMHSFEHDNGMGFGIGWDFPQAQTEMQGLFEPSFCGTGGDVHVATAPDFHPMNFGYEYNDLAHE